MATTRHIPPQADQLKALLAAARSRTRHRLDRLAGGRTRAGWVILAILAGTLLLGMALIPSDVLRGDDANPGGTVLEMAFWLASLAAALESFRVMEAVYRTGDAHTLAPLPIDPGIIYVYRMLGALMEGMVIVVLAAALFAPVAWRGELALYGACMWVWGSGMLVTVAVSLAVALYAGIANLKEESGGSFFGPMAFALGPGIALAISVSIILILKLVAEDVLRVGFGTGARVGSILALGTVLFALGVGYIWARRAYYRAYAGFFEADLFVFDTDYQYFTEGPRSLHW